MPSLTARDRSTFELIIMAAKNDNLVLIQCIDTRTNTEVPVICTYVGKDDEMEMVPLAVQFTTNPYAFIEPPSISESEIH